MTFGVSDIESRTLHLYRQSTPVLCGMSAVVCNTNLLNGFVFQPECINVYIAKLLGYAILAGSIALKFPQILNIVLTKDVEGLSEIAFYSEVPMGITTVMYNYRHGNPFSSYGEVVAILIQNIILVYLLWAFMKPPAPAQTKLGVIACCVSVGFACHTMRPEILYLLPLSNLPIMVWSRLAQILTNFKRGSTGQLSLITNFLTFGGTLARIFTTIQEVGWDLSLLAGLVISAALSGILMSQVSSITALLLLVYNLLFRIRLFFIITSPSLRRHLLQPLLLPPKLLLQQQLLLLRIQRLSRRRRRASPLRRRIN